MQEITIVSLTRGTSMLYNLVKIHRGKEIVFMTDERKLVAARKKQLENSQRGGYSSRIKYEIRPTDTNEKFKRKPENHCRGGGDRQTPRLTKWE